MAEKNSEDCQQSGSKDYWQNVTLKYEDGVTICVRLDVPTLNALRNGENQELMEKIRKNYNQCKTKECEMGKSLQPPQNKKSSLQSLQSEESEGKKIFTKVQEKFIICKYTELKDKSENPLVKRKALWDNITTKVNGEFSTYFTSSQIEGKWKTLLAAYRKFKTDQSKSGSDRKEFAFEAEFETLFGDRHDINPPHVIQSLNPDNGEETVEKDVEISCGSTLPVLPDWHVLSRTDSEETICFSDSEIVYALLAHPCDEESDGESD